MQVAIRIAGFSLMTLFASCGVGAQELDTRIGNITLERELPGYHWFSDLRLYAPTGVHFDTSWTLDDITVVQ